MRCKLGDSRGETLVELLAAILVAALSVALLFTCCTAAASMDRRAKEVDAEHYAALSAAERQETPVADVTATVTIEGNGWASAVEVDLFGGEKMYSYRSKP